MDCRRATTTADNGAVHGRRVDWRFWVLCASSDNFNGHVAIFADFALGFVDLGRDEIVELFGV